MYRRRRKIDTMWLKRNDAKRFICMIITIVISVYPMSLSPVWNGTIPGHRDQYERMAQSILNGHLYLEYEDVDYWGELTRIMDWSKTHVTSTLHICWAALAGLYYHYGVPKHPLKEKCSGVFKHKVNRRTAKLVRGFDNEFYAPHSRFQEVRAEDIKKVKELEILCDSKEAGVYIVFTKGGRRIFVTGHAEYDATTLRDEYFRDLDKGKNPIIPKHYFPNDNPTKKPIVRWRSHANLLFSNWLNYFVYQITPYDIDSIN